MRPPAPFDLDRFAASRNDRPNQFVGVRFSPEGVFLPEPGNTVVRHVVPGSPTERALVDLRARMQALPWAHKFAWTDVESYHMTVFNGLIVTGREPGLWPADMALDMEIAATTPLIDERLAGFEGPGRFDMAIHEVTPFGLTLTGATDADERTARNWRDALTEPFGYRSPGHETYAFHITMAYMIDWLPDDLIAEYRSALAELTAEMREKVPVVDLGPPAFCSFTDMNWFEPVRVLPGSGVEPVVGRRG